MPHSGRPSSARCTIPSQTCRRLQRPTATRSLPPTISGPLGSAPIQRALRKSGSSRRSTPRSPEPGTAPCHTPAVLRHWASLCRRPPGTNISAQIQSFLPAKSRARTRTLRISWSSGRPRPHSTCPELRTAFCSRRNSRRLSRHAACSRTRPAGLRSTRMRRSGCIDPESLRSLLQLSAPGFAERPMGNSPGFVLAGEPDAAG